MIDDKLREDLNIGDDPRLWPWFVVRWQKLTQVTFLKHFDTIASVSFELFPPGGYWSFTIPWGEKLVQYWKPETKEGPKFSVPVYRVVNIRAGWLWIPLTAIGLWQSWPWWGFLLSTILGIFLNWRRDKNSGESYWTLSMNVDHESQRW